MKLINLTPHPIVFADGFTLPKCDDPPRLAEKTEIETEPVVLPNGSVVPIVRKSFDIAGCKLPWPEDKGQFFVVPLLIAQVFAVTRSDLLVIHDPIRDEQGRIVGCRALARV